VNSISYPTINWRLGLLKEYESYESFVAKFCILNYISVRKYIKLYESIILKLNNIELSVFLKEPVSIIDTVFGNKTTINYINNVFLNNGYYCNHDEFRFCNACIDNKYHSYYHKEKWLEICPIHNKRISNCDFLKYGVFCNNRKITYILIMLYKQKNYKFSYKAISNLNFSKLKTLDDWLSRCKTVYAKEYIVLTKDNAIGRNHHPFNFLKLFNKIHPLSNDLRNLFDFSFKKNEIVYEFSKEISDKIKSFLNERCLYSFLVFYHLYCQINNENRDYLPLLKKFIDKIKFLHEKNNCLWNSRQFPGDWMFSTKQHHKNIYIICIYEYIVDEIYKKWIDYNVDTKSEINRIFSIYLDQSLKLIQENFAYRAEGVHTNYFFSLEILLDEQIRDFFDRILLELAKNFINAVDIWLVVNTQMHTVVNHKVETVNHYEFYLSDLYLRYDGNNYKIINMA